MAEKTRFSKRKKDKSMEACYVTLALFPGLTTIQVWNVYSTLKLDSGKAWGQDQYGSMVYNSSLLPRPSYHSLYDRLYSGKN